MLRLPRRPFAQKDARSGNASAKEMCVLPRAALEEGVDVEVEKLEVGVLAGTAQHASVAKTR
jgi:hypothetical protein